MAKKCTIKHKGAVTRYCVGCGELTGSNVMPNPRCSEFHAEYKEWGHKYCPDCGKKL